MNCNDRVSNRLGVHHMWAMVSLNKDDEMLTKLQSNDDWYVWGEGRKPGNVSRWLSTRLCEAQHHHEVYLIFSRLIKNTNSCFMYEMCQKTASGFSLGTQRVLIGFDAFASFCLGYERIHRFRAVRNVSPVKYKPSSVILEIFPFYFPTGSRINSSSE